MKLHQKKCVPCRGDIPPFTKEQIDEYLKYLTDWKVKYSSICSLVNGGISPLQGTHFF